MPLRTTIQDCWDVEELSNIDRDDVVWRFRWWFSFGR